MLTNSIFSIINVTGILSGKAAVAETITISFNIDLSQIMAAVHATTKSIFKYQVCNLTTTKLQNISDSQQVTENTERIPELLLPFLAASVLRLAGDTRSFTICST